MLRSSTLALPNLLTYGRILLVPAVLGLLLTGQERLGWIAVGLYAFAGLTDFLDGYLARRLDRVTSLGQALDPIADKLMVGACLMVLTAIGRISGLNLIPALIILCREFIVSGLREYLATIQVPLPVTVWAKWKTGAQIAALGFLLTPLSWVQSLGLILLWGAAFLTLFTGYHYLLLSMKQ